MISTVLILTIAIVNLTLGVVVASRNYKSKFNLSFASLAAISSIWIVFNYFGGEIDSSQFLSKLMIRLDFATGAILAAVFYWFSVEMIKSARVNVRGLVRTGLIFAAGVSAGLISQSSLAIEFITEGSSVVIVEGPLYWLYVVPFGVMITFGLINLLRAFVKAKGAYKSQIGVILASLFLASAIVGGANVLLPLGDINEDLLRGIQELATVGFAVFVGGSTYAIVRHRLFDIRLVVARSVAYTLLLTTLSAIYAVLIFGVSSVLLDGNNYSEGEQALNITAAILLAFTFQPLKRFFDRITNSIFYRDAYNSEAVIKQINDIVLSSLALEDLLHGIINTLSKELRLQFAFIAIKQVKNVTPTTVSAGDISLSEQDVKDINTVLNKINQRVLLTDEIKDNKLRARLREQNVDLLALIVADPTAKKEGLGYIAFGPKRSGSQYTTKDINLLDIITAELVVAVQNALRYEEIAQFNEQLTRRINEATKELQQKNDKLRELDQAKDDFISMASHQLRTPLTTVKGYLSMLDDGDLGELTEQQQEIIKLAFTSSERMVYLISDLLNASRINTGKFSVQREPVKLKTIIENEVEQLKITAESRDITLNTELSEENPTLKLDPNKIRQVIMNFIDNAIYYSKPGSEVTIRYSVDKDSVELKIIDSGIGVPDSERDNLFSKFYRAENAKRVRPDGTGLGLFLAKKVINAHGGSIIFESEVDKGSTFGFRFALSALATNEQPVN